jgi:methionine synthase / methylenetetrahydrofolate reductase(NADPH)
VSLRAALGRQRVLICDGAMGTMLHAAGNSLDQALPALNLSQPELVTAIHDSYISAGVDLIQTNTFGAARLRLSEHGVADRCEDINRAGARIARQAVPEGSGVLVAGSVSPAVTVRQRHRTSPAQRRAALAEQIGFLDSAGVDLILLETFGYLDELIEALEAAAGASTLPVIAQATFGPDGRTLSGHSAGDVAAATAGAPLAALGTNCVLGPQRSLAIVRELREHTSLPLAVQPNAGVPRRTAPARFEYDTSADYFGRYARRLIDAGAIVVGGCCGTTPDLLAAAVDAAASLRVRDAAAATAAPLSGPVPATASRPPVTLGRADRDLVAVELAAAPGDTSDTAATVRELRELGVDMLVLTGGPGPGGDAIDRAVEVQQLTGVCAMASVPTRDRSIMALQARLLGGHALGLRRIVCETGTAAPRGDYPHVDGVWDVDSIGLVELLARLNRGLDYNGLPLPVATSFEIGARVNPGGRDLGRVVDRTAAKITAGAHFLVTRPVYELTGLTRLLDAVAGRVPVLVAVRPLASFEEAEFLAHEVPDVVVPGHVLRALERAGDDARRVGLDLAAGLAARIRELADGIVVVAPAEPVATAAALITS